MSVARITTIELPELREIRRKALIAAENSSSFIVGKKFDVAKTELISDVVVDNNVDHKELKQEKEAILPVEKRFKPKYGPAEVESRCIQYSSVLITHVIHTNHLYVQKEDQDLPLYRQMMKDLQQEFRGDTSQSHSFCSSPAVGTL